MSATKETKNQSMRKVLLPELMAKLSKQTGLKPQEVRPIIDAYHAAIVGYIESGRSVGIDGYGKYEPKIMRPKRVLNNDIVTVVYTDSKKSMKFVPSPKVTERLTISMDDI